MLYFREVLAMRGTPQTIVSNFVNTSREHMLQKTSYELLGANSHGFCLSIPGILISKGNLPVVDREDSAIGDGDTVNVAREIIEDRTGTLDGRFTVNDPVLLPYGFRQLNIFELPAKTVEEDATKQPR